MDNKPNPEMLILAREIRGLSQAQLAETTGVSQASLSRYETRLSDIPERDLKLFAEALDFPVNFFYRAGKRYGIESGELFHRARRSVPSAQMKRIHGILNLYRLNLQILLDPFAYEDLVKIPNYDIRAFKQEAQDINPIIEQVAASVRAMWNMPEGNVPNLMETLSEAYIFAFPFDFGTDEVDEVVQWIEPLPPIMLYNVNAPGDRLRFSIAHALGHLVMHHYVEPYPEMEREADRFASAFLMPGDDAELASQLENLTIERALQLKPKWKVSIAALIYRAHDLGQISDRKKTSLFQMLSRAGYRTNEPFPLPVEQASLFKDLWSQYEDLREWDTADLAQHLDTYEHDLLTWYFPDVSPIRLARRRTNKSRGGFQTSS